MAVFILNINIQIDVKNGCHILKFPIKTVNWEYIILELLFEINMTILISKVDFF